MSAGAGGSRNLTGSAPIRVVRRSGTVRLRLDWRRSHCRVAEPVQLRVRRHHRRRQGRAGVDLDPGQPREAHRGHRSSTLGRCVRPDPLTDPPTGHRPTGRLVRRAESRPEVRAGDPRDLGQGCRRGDHRGPGRLGHWFAFDGVTRKVGLYTLAFAVTGDVDWFGGPGSLLFVLPAETSYVRNGELRAEDNFVLHPASTRFEYQKAPALSPSPHSSSGPTHLTATPRTGTSRRSLAADLRDQRCSDHSRLAPDGAAGSSLSWQRSEPHTFGTMRKRHTMRHHRFFLESRGGAQMPVETLGPTSDRRWRAHRPVTSEGSYLLLIAGRAVLCTFGFPTSRCWWQPAQASKMTCTRRSSPRTSGWKRQRNSP